MFPAVLKRISEDEELSPGSVLVIHSKAMEPKPVKKMVQVTKEKAAKEKTRKLSEMDKPLSKGTPDTVRPEVQDLRDRVLFKDEHVIVLNKAQGLAVQVRLMRGSGLVCRILGVVDVRSSFPSLVCTAVMVDSLWGYSKTATSCAPVSTQGRFFMKESQAVSNPHGF